MSIVLIILCAAIAFNVFFLTVVFLSALPSILDQHRQKDKASVQVVNNFSEINYPSCDSRDSLKFNETCCKHFKSGVSGIDYDNLANHLTEKIQEAVLKAKI